MQYSKVQIINNITKLLEEGHSNDYALDLFLRMQMMNDLGPEQPFITKEPLPAEVKMHLLGNGTISDSDIKLELTSSKCPSPRLMVKLSPAFTLYAERVHSSLQLTINDKNYTVMYLKSYRAETVALWIIRQKQKLDDYMNEWDNVLQASYKKLKIDHMAFLGIRAIFTEAMKDYPRIKFAVVEQKRRAKIMVQIPDTNLGVYIYAWWGSYKKQLPEQIESLKQLIRVHRKSTIKNFYIHHKR
jgi:hypothetical protein